MKTFPAKTFIIILLTVMRFGHARAQDTTTADGLYSAARKAAAAQQYGEALRLAKKALQIAPKYADIMVLEGRIFAWNKQPDSARVYLKQVLATNEWLEDAYVASGDVEIWNHNNVDALTIIQSGLSKFPYSQELRLRRARLLMQEKQYHETIAETDTLLTMDCHNKQARSLNLDGKEAMYVNRYTFRTDHAHFDKQFSDDWYFTSMEWIRKSKLMPFALRVNYANRFQTDALQYEADAYPRISRTFYLYLNAGFSNDNIFPKWRGGSSLFANLHGGFEAEVGTRYLRYTGDAFFYTAYVGKYYKNFLFGLRTYLTPKDAKVSYANVLNIRYYYGGADDYITLNASSGISPDDRRLIAPLAATSGLKSYTSELIIHKSIRKLNVVFANVQWVNQEYLPDTKGDMIQVGVGYTRHF
jgi:YaiO family outer membrane protein